MATAKPRARKAVDKDKPASTLLEALKFISVAQHSDGTPMQTHCRISDKTVIGFDGGLAAGHYIDENINVCPHTQTLVKALSKCKEAISITELDSGRLSIKSGKFRALVPCVPFGDLPAIQPDPPIAALTDDLKTALRACVPLAQDNGTEPFLCAVLLQAHTAVATNRHVVIEAFHGIDLPPNILLPKASANAVCKSDKPLKAFGFSSNSATFYFADDSFIKTQLFACIYPDYNKILNVEANPWPLPAGFYEALDIVKSFLDNDRVYFIDGKMASSANINDATTYDVEGLTNDLIFNANYLELIRSHAHSIQFNVNAKKLALFFGENVRGGIMGIV